MKNLMACGIVCMFSTALSAQELLETHGDWRVLQTRSGNNTVCYIASLPVKKEGNYKKRGEPYVLVTHKSRTQDEISISSGYPYKDKSEVTVVFGERKHPLFTKGELAWTYDPKSDKQVIKEMIRGKDMVVRGTSWKNTTSKDTYSLNGFTDAHRAMKRLCN